MRKFNPKSTFGLTFSAFIVITCTCFVSWQSIQCLNKYLKHPQGTKLSIDYTANHQFPAITICGDPDYLQAGSKSYNLSHLRFCGING